MKLATSALLAAVVVAAACTEPTTPVAKATRVGPNPNAPRLAALPIGPLPFGPVACLRAKGKPVAESFPFPWSDGVPATLIVTDNGVKGLNGTIELNGVTVVTHPMLGGNAPVALSVLIAPTADNTLVCKLEGKPGSGLTMTVVP
ncbi:MAG TPA: hypothetical protein VJL28_13950 [Gemmatimonadaceae bacterium]|nr:hypothetical protein [Gemmatimonadaceae bacterium]